jgi:diadenosine tetraphosphate (Ap4A) HIT family hydrolase
MRLGSGMDFSIAEFEYFQVTHCADCLVPGYLIVSSSAPVLLLADLSKNAQRELGTVLAKATGAIQLVISPVKIYCAQFGEETKELHFHVFPRTLEITTRFFTAFPTQRDLIHGPVLLDWARSEYRAQPSDVLAGVSPTIHAVREGFGRITSRSTRSRAKTRAPG